MVKSPTMRLEETVGRMQRDLEELQSENRFLKTPRAVRFSTAGDAYDDESTLVQWIDQLGAVFTGF